jgi:hypothetical protein
MKNSGRAAWAAIVAGLLLAGGLAMSAGAAEQHPPKFGVNDSQCVGDSNQPHCPGNH